MRSHAQQRPDDGRPRGNGDQGRDRPIQQPSAKRVVVVEADDKPDRNANGNSTQRSDDSPASSGHVVPYGLVAGFFLPVLSVISVIARDGE
jgi:hypothetical protein